MIVFHFNKKRNGDRLTFIKVSKKVHEILKSLDIKELLLVLSKVLEFKVRLFRMIF